MSRQCVLVKHAKQPRAEPGSPVPRGISAASAGDERLCLQLASLPPGARAARTSTTALESAAYVIEGEMVMWFGERLEQSSSRPAGNRPIYILGGVPHLVLNASDRGVRCRRARTHRSQRAGGRRTCPSSMRSIICARSADDADRGEARRDGSHPAGGPGAAGDLRAGQGPRRPGLRCRARFLDGSALLVQGLVGRDLSLDEAYNAARPTALSMLASLKREFDDLDRVTDGSEPSATCTASRASAQNAKVVNGFSDLIVELWGKPDGTHAQHPDKAHRR